MFSFHEAPLPSSKMHNTRPISSLSIGSSDSGIFPTNDTVYTVPPPMNGRLSSGPPSPAIQINHLLHQTANLLAVNAQLRKQIQQVRAMNPSNRDSDFVFNFDSHQNAFQQLSRSVNIGGKKSPKAESYKTVMCQAWLESRTCAFAENCRFAHGESELRPVRGMPLQNNKYKTKLCDKYTTTGLCPYGTRCLFIHPDNGNNAYIRPDKLVEVSKRHAMADLKPSDNNEIHDNTVLSDLSILSGIPIKSSRHQLRPHPSWPLEPPTFFQEKNDETIENRPISPAENVGKTTEDYTTPGRVSGYASGDSTPSEISPFSTISSSSSLNLNMTDDDRQFELFTFSTDYLAQDLAKALEW